MCACAGIIKLRRSPAPRLRGPQYILNITATDDNASGGPYPLSSATQVIVGINDINNNKPLFHQVTPETPTPDGSCRAPDLVVTTIFALSV